MGRWALSACAVLAAASGAACASAPDGPSGSGQRPDAPATSAAPESPRRADAPSASAGAGSVAGSPSASAPGSAAAPAAPPPTVLSAESAMTAADETGAARIETEHHRAVERSAAADAAADETGAALAVPQHPDPRRARLVFTGDVLAHEQVTLLARLNGSEHLRYDYRPMFSQVRDRIGGADLAICHLETPLSADNTDLGSFPLFNAPGDLAVALADAGYDGCSVASNHSLDRGIEGIAATLATLERVGLGHAGAARTPTEAATPVLYDAGGIAVGHLSYTYGLNGLRLPEDRLWAVDVIEPEAIVAEAEAAVAAGAEFVVLSLHWGWEYTSTPSRQQRQLAHELLADPNIDLIVGTHAHVIQPVDRVAGKYVMYGLGNFLTNQSPQSCEPCPPATVDGVIMEVQIAETPAGRIEAVSIGAVPTWVERPTLEIVDLAAELATDLGPNRRWVLERSWRRTARVLRSAGVNLVIEGDPATVGQADAGLPDVPAAWIGARQ